MFPIAALILSLSAAVAAAPSTLSTQLPLLIWHGLGDQFDADGIQGVAKLAEKINPKTYVYPIRLDEDGGNDRTATFYGNLTEQLEQVCEDIAAHPILGSAPAVNALGFSQGGLFLRAYTERCNAPKVHNLVTFGSPHNGISEFQGCSEGDWLCQGVRSLLRSGAWSSFAQSRLVPAQYYRRINDSTLEPIDDYLEYSNFLADINNEREVKNVTYAENISKLNKLAVYLFKEDKTVIPKESEWFAEVNSTSETVIPLKDRKIYKEDWIGLKALSENDGIDFRTFSGEHMQFSEDDLKEVFEEYFGPIKKSQDLYVQSEDLPNNFEF